MEIKNICNVDYHNMQELLYTLGFNIIKNTTSKTTDYILYRTHDVKNYIILSNGTLNSVVNDMIYYFKQADVNWYVKVIPDNLDKTMYEAKKLVRKYVQDDCPRVQSFINDPARKLIFKEDGLTYFNFFQNTELLVNKPTEEGDWSFIHDLLWNLCSCDEDKYAWVLNWFKCLYTIPTYRFTTSLIFIGDKGSGKGLFSSVLREIFGNTCYNANSKDLISNFNAQLFEGKLLLLANEVVDQKNKYQFSNDLKEFVTETQLSVEKKYSDRYIAKNYIKLIMFSNSRQPVAIEEGDRRYFICHSKPITNTKTYDEINRFVEDKEYFESQVRSFCTYLNNSVDYDFELVTKVPPMTDEKQAIIDINMTDFRSIILEILRDWDLSIKRNQTGSWVTLEDLYYTFHNEDYSEYKYKKVTKRKFASKLRTDDFVVAKNTIDYDTKTRVLIPDDVVKTQKKKRNVL